MTDVLLLEVVVVLVLTWNGTSLLPVALGRFPLLHTTDTITIEESYRILVWEEMQHPERVIQVLEISLDIRLLHLPRVVVDLKI